MNDLDSLERFVAAIPKVELHVHLEGAIQPATLLELAGRHDVDLPAHSERELGEWFRFRDFDEFLQIYLTCSRCLRDPEDFQLLVEDFVAEQARQNILYTEAHFTISTHVAHGANAGEVAEAMSDTIDRAEKSHGSRLRLIPDIVRNVEFKRADQTIEWALDNRERGVIALGLSGKEDYPSAPFRDHFRAAANDGLHRVAHAGEQAGTESIRAALSDCDPERLGHGVRAVEDASLLDELHQARMPLEVCPSSNVQLGIFDSLEEHSFGRLHGAGLEISLNSDDPSFFATTLANEYTQTARAFALSVEELCGIALAAIDHSFLPSGEKSRLTGSFRRRYEELAEEILGRPLEW